MGAQQIRILMIATASIFCAALADPAAAQAQTSQTHYSFCYGDPLKLSQGGPMTTYYSATFSTPDVRLAIIPPSADPLTRGRPDGSPNSPGRAAWAKEFDEFLVQKDSYPASFPVNCETFNTEKDAQDRLHRLMDGERAGKRGVIETGWTFTYTPGQPIPGAVPCYTPQAQHRINSANPRCTADGTLVPTAPTVSATANPPQPAPAAASPPPAAVAPNPPPRAASAPAQPAQPRAAAPPPPVPVVAPPQIYGLCFAEKAAPARMAYFSAIFGPTKVAVHAWQSAFKEVLGSKYQFTGPVNCISDKSEAGVQAYAQRAKDGLRAKAKWDIVDTGWKYQ